jgi:hypothetical protein
MQASRANYTINYNSNTPDLSNAVIPNPKKAIDIVE